MTFSRRAASEMTRVERIARKVMGDKAGIMTDSLAWSGTFHGIGAGLLREYSDRIGFYPSFTIHDREDSADLMNLIRHELGYYKTESRFPMKGTLKPPEDWVSGGGADDRCPGVLSEDAFRKETQAGGV